MPNQQEIDAVKAVRRLLKRHPKAALLMSAIRGPDDDSWNGSFLKLCTTSVIRFALGLSNDYWAVRSPSEAVRIWNRSTEDNKNHLRLLLRRDEGHFYNHIDDAVRMLDLAGMNEVPDWVEWKSIVLRGLERRE